MRVLICAAVAAVLLLGAGCSRPTAKQCDKACLRFVNLHYFAKFESKHAKDTPAEKAKAEKQAEAGWKKFLAGEHTKRNLPACRAQCRSLNNHKEVRCLIHAKTAKAADDCLD